MSVPGSSDTGGVPIPFHPARDGCECVRRGIAEDGECIYPDPCWVSQHAYEISASRNVRRDGATAYPEPSAGVGLIAAERERQIAVEGWTAEHDEVHSEQQLVEAAVCYLLSDVPECFDDYWPWDDEWWKPTPDDRVRELVKAGALIAAEIDRLVHAALTDEGIRYAGADVVGQLTARVHTLERALGKIDDWNREWHGHPWLYETVAEALRAVVLEGREHDKQQEHDFGVGQSPPCESSGGEQR